MKKILIPVFLLTLIVISNVAFAAPPKVSDILRAIDDITELKTDGTAQVEITQQKVGEGVKVYNMIYYRHDVDDSFLIVFTAPESDKGNGYLKQGDNFWVYRRNTRQFQKISRDESISGTDAKAEDFENKKLIDLYKPALVNGKEKFTETMLGKVPVYQFDVVARTEDVSYPKRTYWVRTDNFLPLKIQSYSLSGTLMHTDYFLKYTQIQGKYLFVQGVFIDEFEKGNKSSVEIKNISIKPINAHVFTKAYLENLNK